MAKTVAEDKHPERAPKTESPAVENEEGASESQLTEYDFHLKMKGPNIDTTLKKAAELACKMGLIEKAQISSLITLFVGWGMATLKKTWLNRMGYQ